MKILLVEDDKIAQMVYGHYLEKLNFEVDIVETGCQAISAITCGYPYAYDAMILDLGLPGQKGESVLSAIREDERKRQRSGKLPIIVVTAHSDATMLAKCRALGATDALPKPVSYCQLKHFLHDLI